MADSPSKRRKTSPTTSLPIDAPATPSRIPVLRQEGAKTVSAKTSFASPTRASIARHNPQLLNRPSSSGTGAERLTSRGNLQDVFEKALGEKRQTELSTADGDNARSPTTTQVEKPGASVATTPRRSVRTPGGTLSAKPRRMSRSPVKMARTPIERPALENAPELSGITNPFQKRGLRRSPIPSEANAEANSLPDTIQPSNVDPFKMTGLRRSPLPIQPLAERILNTNEDDGPAEHSTTPPGPPPDQAVNPINALPQSDAVQTLDTIEKSSIQPAVSYAEEFLGTDRQQEVSPVQVTNQSRTSQADQPIGLEGRGRVTEPELPPTPTQLGIPDPTVTTPPSGIHGTPSKRPRRSRALAAKIKSSPLKPRDPPPQEIPKASERVPDLEKTAEEPSQRRKSTRFLIPEDPYAPKKKIRDELLKELQQLQADVALADDENRRLSRQRELKKGGAAPKAPDALLAMLARATAPQTKLALKAKPATIFKSVDLFLPFRSRRRTVPVDITISEQAVPSHLPIDLQGPMPYLQAFSPLTYTSTISLLPTTTPSLESSSLESTTPVNQQHLINVSHPSGLFSSRIAMLVDTSNFTITSLQISQLDSSAEAELGPFIRSRASEGTLGKDVSVICWAMGRWIEVAISRARFWCAVETEFGDLQARKVALERIRNRTKKRKRQGVVEPHVQHDDVDDVVDEAKVRWTRRQLLPHLGRTNMEISGSDVEVRFSWKIGFDWTGEVESDIAADVRLPSNWTQSDNRSSLSRIPTTFKHLVKEQGPLNAVRVVLGLLMMAG